MAPLAREPSASDLVVLTSWSIHIEQLGVYKEASGA